MKFFSIIRTTAIEELGFPMAALDYYQFLLNDFPSQYIFRKVNFKENIVGIGIGTPPQGGVGTILWLIVRPEYRNLKIGTQLFNVLCNEYKALGCHKVKLTATNQTAVDFYKSKGMIVEGFHPSHWWKMNFWSLAKFL